MIYTAPSYPALRAMNLFLGKPRTERLRFIQEQRRIQHNESESLRMALIRRDGYRCACCGCTRSLRLDHVLPVSKGGKTVLRNLQFLCPKCDREKGNAIIDYRNKL